MPRKSLSEILLQGDREKLATAWQSTKAAEDFAPLPAGDYVATIEAGELFTAKSGTAGYKLTFRVAEGEYTGRRFWADTWLTTPALALAKRDLAKIGVTSLDQLERPLPQGIVCTVKLVLRRDDDGTEFNRVRRFDLLRIDVPQPDPFAPTNGNGEHQDTAEHQADAEPEGSESP
jgi:hypothetical protein